MEQNKIRENALVTAALGSYLSTERTKSKIHDLIIQNRKLFSFFATCVLTSAAAGPTLTWRPQPLPSEFQHCPKGGSLCGLALD